MSDYDTDVLLWSEHQTELLRRIAAGEPVIESPDWPTIIEEVGDVGLTTLRARRSLLVQALVHMLKAMAWPSSREVPHWAAEARRFRGDAADAFSPSMRQRIDLAEVYRRALNAMPDMIDGEAPLPVPEVCPVTLEELLSSEPAA
jgi:hypothetical protein